MAPAATLKGVFIALVFFTVGGVAFIIGVSVAVGVYFYYMETIQTVGFAICAVVINGARKRLAEAGPGESNTSVISSVSGAYYTLLVLGTVIPAICLIILLVSSVIYIAALVLAVVADVCAAFLSRTRKELRQSQMTPPLLYAQPSTQYLQQYAQPGPQYAYAGPQYSQPASGTPHSQAASGALYSQPASGTPYSHPIGVYSDAPPTYGAATSSGYSQLGAK